MLGLNTLLRVISGVVCSVSRVLVVSVSGSICQQLNVLIFLSVLSFLFHVVDGQ